MSPASQPGDKWQSKHGSLRLGARHCRRRGRPAWCDQRAFATWSTISPPNSVHRQQGRFLQQRGVAPYGPGKGPGNLSSSRENVGVVGEKTGDGLQSRPIPLSPVLR